jgi:hypothetical protein
MFRYVPTQDGPCHLYNAMIIADHGRKGTLNDHFFVVQLDPLPNWTAQAALVGLLNVVDPLTAEKILLSVHIVLFGVSFHYFISFANPGLRVAPLLGLAFVFNHCFWMGFYNYCLSLDVYWLCTGYYLRRGDALGSKHVGMLSAIFLASYFTHLMGFLIAAFSILALAAWNRRPLWSAFLMVVAMCPSGLLTLWYFHETRFLSSGTIDRLVTAQWRWLQPAELVALVERTPTYLNQQLFGPLCEVGAPVGVLILSVFGLLLIATFGQRHSPDRQSNGSATSRARLTLLVWITVSYLLLPDDLEPGHGGYIKQRVAILIPLLILTFLRQPSASVVSSALLPIAIGVFALNLANATYYVSRENRTLSEYTVGSEALGTKRVIVPIQPVETGRMVSDPLLHAACYYCFVGGNVCLDNYEAASPNFPVKFRDPAVWEAVRRLQPGSDWNSPRGVISTVIVWDSPGYAPRDMRGVFRQVFAAGRLTIYERK